VIAARTRRKTWAQDVRAWRRESGVVNFLFIFAEMVESLVRLPLLTAMLWLVLPPLYEIAKPRRQRKTAKEAAKKAASSAARGTSDAQRQGRQRRAHDARHHSPPPRSCGQPHPRLGGSGYRGDGATGRTEHCANRDVLVTGPPLTLAFGD
jgi:hypothetical protein